MKKKFSFLMASILACALSTNVWADGTNVTASYIGDLTKIVNAGGATATNKHKQSDGIGWYNTQTLSGWHNYKSITNGMESWTPSTGTAGVMIGRKMALPAGKYTLSFECFATNQGGTTSNVVAFCGDQEQDCAGTDFVSYSFDIDVTTANTIYEFGVKLKDGGAANWTQIHWPTLTLTSTDITPVPNTATDGWTQSFSSGSTGALACNTWSTEGQSDGSDFLVPFIQVWASSGNALSNQTIENSYTPNTSGVYKVTAWVRAYNESGGAISGAKIYVDSVEADACGGAAITKGTLGTYSAMADGVAGTPIKYGIKIENAAINWISFKNFTVTYLPDGIPADEITALKKQVPTGKMNATIKHNLDGYISALETNKSVAAYNTLAAYIPTAQASVNVYTNIKALIDKANDFDGAGKAAFDSVAATALTAYNDSTITDGVTETTEINSALQTGALSQTTAGSDMTLGLVNPSFEEEITTGWTQDGTIELVRQGNTAFGKDGAWYAEKWEPNGTANIHQTITILHDGKYTLTGHFKARDVTSASVYAQNITKKDTVSTDITIEDNENDYSAKIALYKDDQLKLGFTAVGTGASASWICADNFRLVYDGPYVPVTSVTVSCKDTEVEIGKTTTLTATVLPADASFPSVTFASSTPSIATIDATTGVVTAVAEGTASFTATADGVSSDAFNLTITKPAVTPTAVTFDKSELTAEFSEIGTTATLTATVGPEGAAQDVVWATSDASVASVENGVVTYNQVGTATITATASGYPKVYGTVTVTVKPAAAPTSYSDITKLSDNTEIYLKNVATGQIMFGSNSWGTQASVGAHGIPFTIAKINDGVYTLDSKTYNNASSHYFTGTYVDGSATNIYFTALGNGKYGMSTAEGSAYVRANGNIVINDATNSNSPYAQWYVLTKKEAYRSNCRVKISTLFQWVKLQGDFPCSLFAHVRTNDYLRGAV